MERRIEVMLGYKLFRKRKDGTYGSLFINQRKKYVVEKKYFSESHRTNGYAFRPFFHICHKPIAPHLSLKNRVWCLVEFELEEKMERPEHQGGMWYLARSIVIKEELQK